MTHPSIISRRLFLTLATGAAAAPRVRFAQNEVPTLLDHILLGCPRSQNWNRVRRKPDFRRPCSSSVELIPAVAREMLFSQLGDRRYLEILRSRSRATRCGIPSPSNSRSCNDPSWSAGPRQRGIFLIRRKTSRSGNRVPWTHARLSQTPQTAELLQLANLESRR